MVEADESRLPKWTSSGFTQAFSFADLTDETLGLLWDPSAGGASRFVLEPFHCELKLAAGLPKLGAYEVAGRDPIS